MKEKVKMKYIIILSIIILSIEILSIVLGGIIFSKIEKMIREEKIKLQENV